jgi:hypothetical protein
MKIKPLDNYRCATYSRPPLDKNKIYKAVIATNIPNYKELGLVFCDDYLLNKNEYKIIERK